MESLGKLIVFVNLDEYFLEYLSDNSKGDSLYLLLISRDTLFPFLNLAHSFLLSIEINVAKADAPSAL